MGLSRSTEFYQVCLHLQSTRHDGLPPNRKGIWAIIFSILEVNVIQNHNQSFLGILLRGRDRAQVRPGTSCDRRSHNGGWARLSLTGFRHRGPTKLSGTGSGGSGSSGGGSSNCSRVVK